MEKADGQFHYLKESLEELKARQKEDRDELKYEMSELRREVSSLNTFLSEVKGGKHLIWGFVTFAAAAGAAFTYISQFFHK